MILLTRIVVEIILILGSFKRRAKGRGGQDNLSEGAVAVLTVEDLHSRASGVENAGEILGNNLDAVEIDVTENEDAMRSLKKLGHGKVPTTYRGGIRDGKFKPSSDYFRSRNKLQLKKESEMEKGRK